MVGLYSHPPNDPVAQADADADADADAAGAGGPPPPLVALHLAPPSSIAMSIWAKKPEVECKAFSATEIRNYPHV